MGVSGAHKFCELWGKLCGCLGVSRKLTFCNWNFVCNRAKRLILIDALELEEVDSRNVKMSGIVREFDASVPAMCGILDRTTV
jgi:hypothetical protein